MLLSILRGGSFDLNTLLQLLIFIPIILFSLSFHEFSHALVANLLGDPTAKNMGRLSINPLKHLDLVGAISMLLCGIGWAKPVPINPNNFKDKKLDMALSSFAGPLSNLLLSFVSDVLSYVFLGIYAKNLTSIFYILAVVFYFSARTNAFLAVFNLIPIPPFDGSRLFLVFLPEDKYFSIMRYEEKIKIVFIILFFLGVFDKPLDIVTNGILDLFDKIIGFLPII